MTCKAKQRLLRDLRGRLLDTKRVLMLPDLTAEERKEYAEAAENLRDRIAEVESMTLDELVQEFMRRIDNADTLEALRQVESDVTNTVPSGTGVAGTVRGVLWNRIERKALEIMSGR